MTPSARSVPALALSLAMSGCTLVGSVAGAETPKYDRAQAEPPAPVDVGALRLAPGDALVVECVRDGRSERIEGRFVRTQDGALVLATKEGEVAVPIADAKRVSVKRGNYLLTGFLVGVVIDGILVGLAAVVVNVATHTR